MQLRHLRYFVRIIEAGSFSRAAASLHVAQPALSQQIAELEQRLAVQLLQRTPRGVTKTEAGEALYREASAILQQVERLPGLVRSTCGDPQGITRVGISVVLGSSLTGPMIATVRKALPKVSLKVSNADSATLTRRVQSQELDLALVYEDELVPTVARQPLFRHRLHLVSYKPIRADANSISLHDLAAVPLILPPRPHLLRTILDRACAAANVSLSVAAEIDMMSMSSAVDAMKAGAGAVIVPNNALIGADWAEALAIEPPLYTNAALIWQSDVPLTAVGDAVRVLLMEFVEKYLKRTGLRGMEWIGPVSAEPAVSDSGPE